MINLIPPQKKNEFTGISTPEIRQRLKSKSAHFARLGQFKFDPSEVIALGHKKKLSDEIDAMTKELEAREKEKKKSRR